MRFIEEVVVDEFLPAFRCMLAERLSEAGLTQREIAEVMGVSQSAVSNYLHGTPDHAPGIRDHPGVQALVEQLSEGLATGDMSRVHALAETEVLIRELEAPDGLIADLYATADPTAGELVGEFTTSEAPALTERTRVLASVRRGLRILETTPGVVDLLPNVGTNLVEATPGATTPDDIAGVPGRLYDVRGRLIIPADPEFGTSHHVASVLLAARSHGHPARAAVNLRYHPNLITRLEALGHTTAEFTNEDDLEQTIPVALAPAPDVDVLYQTGGYGIEPITYLLGPDAETTATAVRSLARHRRRHDSPE